MAKRTLSQKIIEQSLPQEIRRIRRASEKRTRVEQRLQEQRTKPRVNIHDLNKEGISALQKAGVTPQQLRDPDPRSGFEKVLDWVDMPRNAVAQIVGRLSGVKFDDIKARGAFGMKRVFMSDVLKRAGVKNKVVRAVGGFLGDIAIDPLTYITAGATTGRAISRFLPKVTTPFAKTLRGITKGVRPANFDAIAKALFGSKFGVQRLNKLLRLAPKASKDVQKKLFHKSGGVLTRLLEKAATRPGPRQKAVLELLKQSSIKGRKLFRIPFTQLAGPTLKVGRQARLFKALSKPGSLAVQAELQKVVRRIQQINTLTANIDELRAAGKTAQAANVAAQSRVLKGKVIGQSRALGLKIRSGPTQFSSLMEQAENAIKSTVFSKEASGVQQELLRSAIGTTPKKKLGRSLREVVGPGRSPLRSREMGLVNRMTFGAQAGSHRIFQKFQPLVDKLTNTLVAERVVANADEGRALIFNALELGDMSKLNNFHATSPLRDKVDELAAIFGRADYQELATGVQKQTQAWVGDLQKLGLSTPEIENYLPHLVSPEAQPFLSAQLSGRGFGQLLQGQRVRQTRGLFGSPFLMRRNRLVELFGKDGVRKQFLTRSAADIDQFKAANKGWRQLYEVVDEGGNVTNQVMLGADNIPRVEKTLKITQPGATLRAKEWNVSAAWFNRAAERGELKTILGADAPDLKRFFETDPARSLAARAAQQERAIAGIEIKQLSDQFGVVVDIPSISKAESLGLRIPKDIAGDHPIREFLKEGIYPTTGAQGPRMTAYPEPVAAALDRMADMFKGGKELNMLTKASDMTLGWFKRWALFHPAYVVRNMWQNLFGTVMAGGNPIKAARYSFLNKKVRLLAKAIDSNNLDMLGDITIKLSGKDVPLRLLAEDALKYNFAGAGFTAAQTVPTYLRGTGARALIGRRADAGTKWAIDLVRNYNTALETKMRLGAWLGFIDDGMSGRRAAMQTLLAMPDLSDVTLFERNVMTRIFPWYRWLKNNGAMQLLHYLPQKPSFIAGVRKLQTLIESFDERVPNNLRPKWLREAQAAQFTGSEHAGSAFLLRTWFPFEEVQSFAAGTANPAETARFLVGGSRPGLKFAAELATSSDVFRQRRVEPFSMAEAVGLVPKALVGASGTPLDNLLAIRPAREFGRRVFEQPDTIGKISRAALGGAIQPLSAERGLQEIDLSTASEIAKLRRKIIRAKENQDAVEVQNLLQQLMRLQVQRLRSGLTVPKDTERVLGAAGVTPEVQANGVR